MYAVKSRVSTLKDEQTVTLGLENGKYIQFQIDNGASVNVLPVQVYKRASGDHSMKLVTKTSDNAKIVAYGDVSWPIEGTGIMRVWIRKDSHPI